MLFLALFLAGLTSGILITLFIFAPESREESWDLQHFPHRLSDSLSAGNQEKISPAHNSGTVLVA